MENRDDVYEALKKNREETFSTIGAIIWGVVFLLALLVGWWAL